MSINTIEAGLTVVTHDIEVPEAPSWVVASGAQLVDRLGNRIGEASAQVSRALAANGQTTVFVDEKGIRQAIEDERAAAVLDRHGELVSFAKVDENHDPKGSIATVPEELFEKAAKAGAMLGHKPLLAASRLRPPGPIIPGMASVAMREVVAIGQERFQDKAIIAITRAGNDAAAATLRNAGLEHIGYRTVPDTGGNDGPVGLSLIFHKTDTPVTPPRGRRAA